MKQTVLNLILCLCVGAGLIFLGCGGGGTRLAQWPKLPAKVRARFRYLNPIPMALMVFSTLSASLNRGT